MTPFTDPAGNIIGEVEHEALGRFIDKFGPVPSGLSLRALQSAYQPFGMASVGSYPPPVPPKEQADYIKRVEDAGRKAGEERRAKQIADAEKKRLKAVAKLRASGPIILAGDASFDWDYDDVKWIVGGTDILVLISGAYGDLGPMRVTIEFLNPEGKATP